MQTKQKRTAETDYQRNRARRMSALADVEQLRLKRIHGELHHSQDVEFLMTGMLTAFKQRLLALPSRCAPYVMGKSNLGEVAETIRLEIYDALRELADYNPNAFAAANEQYLAGIGLGKPEKNGEKN